MASGRALSRDMHAHLKAGESFIEKPYDLFAMASRLADAAATRQGDHPASTLVGDHGGLNQTVKCTVPADEWQSYSSHFHAPSLRTTRNFSSSPTGLYAGSSSRIRAVAITPGK